MIKTVSEIIYLSKYSYSNPYSHVICDDSFYIQSFRTLEKRLTCLIGKSSFKINKDKGGKNVSIVEFNYNNLITELTTNKSNALVVCNGYYEPSSLILILACFLKGYYVCLLPTNNISIYRLYIGKQFLKFFYKFATVLKVWTLCNNNWECYLLKRFFNYKLTKTKVYHKLCYNKVSPEDYIDKNQIINIIYIGPDKNGKSIGGLKNFISHAKGTYKFTVVNVEEQLPPKDNLTILKTKLDNFEYGSLMRSAHAIWSGHNDHFVGKISGMLCDSIEHEVPIIEEWYRPTTKPMSMYINSITYNPNIHDWIKKLESKINATSLNKIKVKIREAKSIFNKQLATDSLLNAIKSSWNGQEHHTTKMNTQEQN